MMSVYSVLFTLVLFAELSSHRVTVAMPATKVEDGIMEQEGLGLIPGDEPLTEPDVIHQMYRRNLVLEEDANPKIIVISDLSLKGHGVRGPNPAVTRSLPLPRDRSLSHTDPEYSLKIDRRNANLDMLRCMVGRVYRPCWEV
ncbi:pro-MCH [Embiotoca jacksoni]|uniref:pro-MCH n=1 Tax=Embiotoca jacksoni TaxID=100190 RepID=UPI0037048A70